VDRVPVCLICGKAHWTCGGPTEVRPVDVPIVLEGTQKMSNEFVLVEMKPGDVRKFTREDADRFIGMTAGARIVGTVEARPSITGPDDKTVPFDSGEKPQEPSDPVKEGEEGTPAKPDGQEEPSKAQRPAADKAVRGPREDR
jgi:hypothetical protein